MSGFFHTLRGCVDRVCKGGGKLSSLIRKDKRMREGLSEKQVDKTDEDSFPASDPPGRY